jgi:Acetyltransferase (GNAT) domain
MAFRDLRFQGVASGVRDAGVVDLASADFAEIAAYDRAFTPAARDAFLAGWIAAPGVIVMGLRENARLAGYGVARPCRLGYKIGPLFAERADIAKRIAGSLMARFVGEQAQIDLPEANPAAVALAEAFGLQMRFGCMRLYYGPQPALPIERIFAVTLFEFG